MPKQYLIFKTCDKGHDLEVEKPFIFDNGGRRSCRQCAVESKKINKKKPKKSAF